MKKRQPIKKPRTLCSATENFREERSPASRRQKTSQFSSDLPLEEPGETPRLFIRGLPGGSIKTDLGGIGINLSESSFGFSVPDDSLKDFGIYRGDITIIDPMRDMLQKGNFVLFDSNGCSILRRLTKKRGLWYVEAAKGTKSKPMPILDQPLHGMVVGVIRLFAKLSAINYRRTSESLRISQERSCSGGVGAKARRGVATGSARPSVHYSKGKRAPFLFVAEEQSPYRLSEI